jgi:hypothetical protein
LEVHLERIEGDEQRCTPDRDEHGCEHCPSCGQLSIPTGPAPTSKREAYGAHCRRILGSIAA